MPRFQYFTAGLISEICAHLCNVQDIDVGGNHSCHCGGKAIYELLCLGCVKWPVQSIRLHVTTVEGSDTLRTDLASESCWALPVIGFAGVCLKRRGVCEPAKECLLKGIAFRIMEQGIQGWAASLARHWGPVGRGLRSPLSWALGWAKELQKPAWAEDSFFRPSQMPRHHVKHFM